MEFGALVKITFKLHIICLSSMRFAEALVQLGLSLRINDFALVYDLHAELLHVNVVCSQYLNRLASAIFEGILN